MIEDSRAFAQCRYSCKKRGRCDAFDCCAIRARTDGDAHAFGVRLSGVVRALAASLLSLAAAGPIAADAARGGRALGPDDFYAVQDVSDPEVSPDGQWV